MRRYLVLLVIALQIAVMASVVVKREAILASDDTVVLRTAPVDPRDPFRGDFVILDYEANAVPIHLGDKAVVENAGHAFQRVYAWLEVDSNGVASVSKLSVSPPDDGVFLRGSVGNDRYWWSNGDSLRVKYGIEKLFVEQGLGLEMETQVGQGDDWQQPMEVTVGLADDGTAGIKSWRWSDVAFRLEVKETGIRPNDDSTEEPQRISPLVKFSVKNKGDIAQAFYNPSDNCGLGLLDEGRNPVPMLNDSCQEVEARESDQIVLQPGETLEWEVDFAAPRWHVNQFNHQGEIGLLDIWQRFRLVYQPPENLKVLSAGTLAWGSRVYSPAFANSGVVD